MFVDNTEFESLAIDRQIDAEDIFINRKKRKQLNHTIIYTFL